MFWNVFGATKGATFCRYHHCLREDSYSTAITPENCSLLFKNWLKYMWPIDVSIYVVSRKAEEAAGDFALLLFSPFLICFGLESSSSSSSA